QLGVQAHVRDLHGGDPGAQCDVGLPAGRDGDPGGARLELSVPQSGGHGGLPVGHQLEPAGRRPFVHDLEVVRHGRAVEREQRGGEGRERGAEGADLLTVQLGGEGLVLGGDGADAHRAITSARRAISAWSSRALPTATTRTPASRKSGALRAFIPPVATKRICGNGPAMAGNQPVPSREAGKAFAQCSPAVCARCTSVAVATPGREASPASSLARTTSRSRPGLTVKAAPSSAAASTVAASSTVPAPTCLPRSRPAATTSASASRSVAVWSGTSTASMPRCQAVRAGSRLRWTPMPRRIAIRGAAAKAASKYSMLSVRDVVMGGRLLRVRSWRGWGGRGCWPGCGRRGRGRG